MNDLNAIGDQNLGQLPGLIYLKVRDHLDISPTVQHGWRAFVAVLDGDFTMSDIDVAAIERVKSHNSCAAKLFNMLGARGMTIRQFVHYACLAEDNFIMDLFNLQAAIKIIDHPPEEVHVKEYDPLRLTVKASGRPQPRYQWYKNNNRMDGETQSILSFDETHGSDAGVYICVVHSEDMKQCLRCEPTTVIVDVESSDLEVKENPSSCFVVHSGNALFRCEVWGAENLTYQWYKGETALVDGQDVKGSQTRELRIYNIKSVDWQGWYYCEVSSRSQTVTTRGALLQLVSRMKKHHETTEYTATDKVVLLIGCSDYRGDKLLTAPINDVQALATSFQALNFKVVSLLNLTKLEIISAVHEFKELVSEGVYCVFYFCGHGFEGSSGLRYLVPSDAPLGYDNTHCIAAEQIFHVLLQKKPGNCCMILDTCRRIRPESKPEHNHFSAVETGNAIVCYATSYGLCAYEERDRGILVSHLKDILGEPIPIEHVFTRLRESLGKDTQVNVDNPSNPHKQIPDVKTNLSEPGRSFADSIVYTGYTSEFNRRQLAWHAAHKKPDARELEFSFADFTVTVQLDFQPEFSNILKVYMSVTDPGPTEECIAYVSGVPTDVGEKMQNKIISTGRSCQLNKTYVTITNIQRLKSPMNLEVTVKCKRASDQSHLEKAVRTDLGWPLVSSLHLWRERPDLSLRREAVEQEESSAGDESRDFYG
ncbi:mucosa-associated lymphoid tissue lymphoma translocation protein 1 isoform X2 [Aplysia californica]|uniref:Mucosa-associated lymphoid tissue lymphoma translocation protein 1 isoform X2 n=1 Tax=Aplysia californica TaxID=6500 RepID=A0ABM0JIP2_APLCA|nr:mucosa-associated lymphoid tissue lymphoma translocation protein 1 isoform X2 [Aplysia californica]